MKIHRRRMLVAAITLAYGLVSTTPAYALFGVGDIVFDPTAVANLIKQLSEMAKQYQNMVQQLTQARQTYESIKGIRNFGSLFKALNDPLILNSLPAEARMAVRDTDKMLGNLGELSDNIAKAEKMTSRLTSGDFKDNPYGFGRWQGEVRSIAAQYSVGEQLYNSSVVRAKKLQDLFRAIGTAGDLKAIQDLNARIQAEMIALKNEDAQMQGLAMMQQAEQRRLEREAQDHYIQAGQQGIPEVKFPKLFK